MTVPDALLVAAQAAYDSHPDSGAPCQPEALRAALEAVGGDWSTDQWMTVFTVGILVARGSVDEYLTGAIPDEHRAGAHGHLTRLADDMRRPL